MLYNLEALSVAIICEYFLVEKLNNIEKIFSLQREREKVQIMHLE
jgi:hypothetical protein